MFWPSKELPLERWFEVWTLPSSTDSKLIDNNPIFFDWQQTILSQLSFFLFVPINQRTRTEMMHNLQNMIWSCILNSKMVYCSRLYSIDWQQNICRSSHVSKPQIKQTCNRVFLLKKYPLNCEFYRQHFDLQKNVGSQLQQSRQLNSNLLQDYFWISHVCKMFKLQVKQTCNIKLFWKQLSWLWVLKVAFWFAKGRGISAVAE